MVSALLCIDLQATNSSVQISWLYRARHGRRHPLTPVKTCKALLQPCVSLPTVYISPLPVRSHIYIWSTKDQKELFRVPLGNHSQKVNQLGFSPQENLLAWTDEEGSFHRWKRPVPSNLPDPSVTPKPVTEERKGPDLFGGADLLETKDIDDVGEADVDAESLIDENFAIDEDDGEVGRYAGEDAREKESKKSKFVKEMVSITKAQLPFQPGSTPSSLRKRYLAYNMLGVIEATDQDTHQIINVEFFDKSARKGFHFVDHNRYDLGYLGERGAVFACPRRKTIPPMYTTDLMGLGICKKAGHIT
ncbi:DNA polymerase alpha accessory factor Mcl1 [Marasmius tenuissimus]|nr:DNA polymerase alpha accessory factor Mcl1 [Marasmius tenuissimus]